MSAGMPADRLPPNDPPGARRSLSCVATANQS